MYLSRQLFLSFVHVSTRKKWNWVLMNHKILVKAMDKYPVDTIVGPTWLVDCHKLWRRESKYPTTQISYWCTSTYCTFRYSSFKVMWTSYLIFTSIHDNHNFSKSSNRLYWYNCPRCGFQTILSFYPLSQSFLSHL